MLRTADRQIGLRLYLSVFAQNKTDVPTARNFRLIDFRINHEMRCVGVIVEGAVMTEPIREPRWIAEWRDGAATEPAERLARDVERLGASSPPARREHN